MAKQTKTKKSEITIVETTTGTVDFYLLGRTPLLFNKISEKAKRELLYPGKKSHGSKRKALKHDPFQEYKDSFYRMEAEDSPTLFCMPATVFKGALVSAATDMEDVSKAEIGRLSFVEGEMIPVYGRSFLHMGIVRQAGINKTPDVRTRAIIPYWACRISITIIKPMLNETAIANLLSTSGITCGIGDFRQQKGKGNYGQFRLVGADDLEWQKRLKYGREEQIQHVDGEIQFYDNETAELYGWFNDEIDNRGDLEKIKKTGS